MAASEDIANIVSNVKLLCGITDTESDTRLGAFAAHYYGMAQGITGYECIPADLLSYVTDAALKAWRKRGAEELHTSTALGVSEAYIDIDEKLRKHLRTKRNPLTVNFIPVKAPDPEPDPDDAES